MAALKTVPIGFSSQTQGMLKDLVDPRERLDVPNHILDTQIFSKLSQNSTVKIQPSVVHFGGYKLNKPLKRKIKICNASAERQNIHIIPPATKYFSIAYTKPDRFVPGFTIEVVINFIADEWRYFYDCIRVHCKGNENIIIPLHAFPVMDTSKFPRKLVFPPYSVSLGESCSKILPLYSHSPIEFEFQITVIQPHPAIEVSPMSGIVPGEGETDIVVTYTPKEYVTANMTIQLAISQFNTEPLQCHITASCTPVIKHATSKSIKDMDELYKQTKVLDPRSITPLQISRRRQKSSYRKITDREIEYEGFQFPTKLNTQHAVNSVLMQEKGKLKVKDLREVVLAKSESKVDAAKSSESITSAESTRQMKEAAFEKIVRQDAVEERANQLRWQVHLGLDPMTDEARLAVAEQRKNATFVYKYTKRKEPFVDQELLRPAGDKNFQRSRRKANEVNKCGAHFDLYKNNSWSVRHRALSRFQQAARTVLIRCRADKKVKMLQKMVEDFKAGLLPDQFPVVASNEDLPSGTSPFQVEGHDHNGFAQSDPIDALLSTFTPSKVKPFTFPVYVSPDTKEDIAPDALGEVPFKSTEVTAQRNVPYQDLVVPKYYELAGYTRHSVYECLNNYVPPGLVRQLRVGAEDEIIRGTFATNLISDDVKTSKGEPSIISTEEGKPQISDTTSLIQSECGISTKSTDKQSSSGLIPPSGLFKNPPTHRLYIFNRMPGIVEHSIPLEHSEIDPDYHLCPIPRYTMLPHTKKFLHRQDVIKGTMLWKRFSSHGLSSLSNTPTLSNSWLPRWSDCLSQAMTPDCTPDLLTQLPEDDEQNLLPDELSSSAFPLLTPEMIQAHFPIEKDLHDEQNKLIEEEGSPKKEEQISSTRYPTYNSESAGRLGATMRDERELLENHTKGMYNKLGERTSQLAKLCDFEIED